MNLTMIYGCMKSPDKRICLICPETDKRGTFKFNYLYIKYLQLNHNK